MAKAKSAPNPSRPRGFKARLHSWLTEKELTQSKLAKKSGIDPATLSKLASGDRLPTFDQAIALARAIEIPIGEFLAEAGLEELMTGWVPIAELEKLQNEHLEVVKAANAHEASAKAAQQELALLTERVKTLSNELQATTARVQENSELVAKAAECQSKVKQAENLIETLQREKRLAEGKSAELEHQLASANRLVQHNYHCSAERDRIIEQLKVQLAEATNSKTAAAWVSALLGGVAVAVVAGALASSRD